ncbi:hypothetical protein AWB85_15115 [Mycobacteroides immunogenum]|uniref:M23ase beta-sheet core domain-containing protein n=1 Tax=Mycobacteroides immunogenum TaxID=83262 RepID=A0A179V7H2_9MYCO|nr:M23 family metallopeptidase [Mycobacteroides immunogenum]OAT66951.1 hypothetical protein AWB85_15115 [Mycobacteroides immunogenum]
MRKRALLPAALAVGIFISPATAQADPDSSQYVAVIPAAGKVTDDATVAHWGAVKVGVRIENAIGTPVLAAADGIVTTAGRLPSNDTVVEIRHPDGATTRYWHVDTWAVSPTQSVKAGEQIATFGENHVGDGLYFAVSRDDKPVDARAWLASHGAALGPLEF